jgi:septal ring factor EnvC (AmiA/AmiB activator)
MRKMFLILSVLILLSVIYFVILNMNNDMSLHVMYSTQTNAELVEQSSSFVRNFNVGMYTLLVLFAGLFAGAGTVYMFLSVQKDKVKAYQRELEKTSISGANNASRVEVLEAKIQTLEKAFNTVIDERTQLEIQIKNLNAEIDNMRGK